MRIRVLLVLALAWCAAASAQQVQPVTYVADFNVKPGKEGEFLNLVKKYDEPIFTKLMAEGAVMAWGVDIPMNHREGMPTHSFWWSSPDMGGFDKVFAAFEEAEKKWGEDHDKAVAEARRRRQAEPKSVSAQFLETVDIAKHRDWIFRDLVVGFASAPPPAGAKPYSWISLTRVLPGKAADYRQLWEKYAKPVYDKLVAEGAINAYGLGTEEIRSTDAFTHFTWVSLPNLAAREKVRAAFAAASQARSEETRRQITDSFQAVTDGTASRALILRAIVFHVAPPPR